MERCEFYLALPLIGFATNTVVQVLPIFNRAKIGAMMNERDLHFHDLRGTAVTKLYIFEIPERVIAEIMAWEEEHVAKIIRRYVDRSAATKALIRQINESRT